MCIKSEPMRRACSIEVGWHGYCKQLAIDHVRPVGSSVLNEHLVMSQSGQNASVFAYMCVFQ